MKPQVFKWKQPPTAQNASIITAYVAAAEGGDFGPPFAPCAVVHPWMDSCGFTALDRWQAVFKWMFPVYAALHVIPPILLRRKVFFKESVLFSRISQHRKLMIESTVRRKHFSNPHSAR